MDAQQRLKFIFIVDTFPSLSETFILNQITGLIDLGHEVFIVSASRSSEHQAHKEVHTYDLLKKIYYHNERPQNKAKRILWALLMILVYGRRNPKAVLNSLNFFKYGREALSLTYLYKVMLFLGLPKADILFCHYGPNGNFAALMKDIGIAGRLVVMFHGYDIRQGVQQPGLYQPLFQRADAIFSISKYSYQHLLRFGAPVEKIRHHPVGIDISRYVRFAPRTVLDGEPVKILTVARLVAEKGLSYGIEALRRVVYDKKLMNVHYTIIGDGPFKNPLYEQVEKSMLKHKVSFLGYQTQEGVEKLLGQSHIFFLPSVQEALPVVLMEAQAAGLPVVATNVGGIAEIIQHGRSGYVVEPENVSAMADRLEDLIRHPEQWPSMAEEGRQQIREHYDIKALNQSLSDLCRRMINS